MDEFKYIISYSFNGSLHSVLINNLADCLRSFVLASQAGRLENVTIKSNY